MNEDSVFFEKPGYLYAIIGSTYEGNIVYSYSKMIDYLRIEKFMSEAEAVEYIEINALNDMFNSMAKDELAPIIVYDLEEDIELQDEICRRHSMEYLKI